MKHKWKRRCQLLIVIIIFSLLCLRGASNLSASLFEWFPRRRFLYACEQQCQGDKSYWECGRRIGKTVREQVGFSVQEGQLCAAAIDVLPCAEARWDWRQLYFQRTHAPQVIHTRVRWEMSTLAATSARRWMIGTFKINGNFYLSSTVNLNADMAHFHDCNYQYCKNNLLA